jgi:RHS repeat-associated protein
VSLTSPANGATFTAPATITLTATAADSDGTIAKVEFFHGGTNLIATVTSAPYTFNWTNVAAGSYSLTARATDNLGAQTTSAAVNVTVNAGVAQLYFIHTDHLNTPRLVANEQGQTVWRWDQQEPFGVNVPDENPAGLGAFEFALRFPGQYFDKETNLHYNYFRDYDPNIGRYAASDLIGLKGGLNTYAYVESDPLSYIDPNGLQLAPGGALGGSSGLGVGGALGGRGLIPGKQRPDDAAGALGEYMQPGTTPTAPILATPVNPDEVIAGAPVPPFPGIQNLSADCKPGKRVVFVIARGSHKGRTNIEQEYQCTCGLVTWHLIVTPNGKIVHNHFRAGGAKGTADD